LTAIMSFITSLDNKRNMSDKIHNFAEEIETLKKTTPMDTTNKYIEGLIEKARNEGRSSSKSSGFWNGFLLGIVITAIIMLLWRS
jgi:galactokinase/mevalonate kinase-like predicted kinase